MNQILFLCNYKSTYSGNFIKSLHALTGALEGKYKCHFIFPIESKSREWIKMLRDHSIDFMNFDQGEFSFVSCINNYINNNHIDILYVHFVSVNYAKIILNLNRKVRVFVHVHSDFSCGVENFLLRVRQFITYRLFTDGIRFLCVSEALAGLNPPKSVWIPNGLVCDSVPRTEKNREAVRESLHIRREELLCELFGWSPQIKGVDIAVQAVKVANAGGLPCKLAIVCGREYDEAKMRQYISTHTSCAGDEDFLIYLPPAEDVFAYHHLADVHLSASRSEGFSYSILEMLSIGKRCVISDIPGTSWAQEYGTVVSFQSGNADACAKALAEAANLPPCDESTAEEVKRQYSIEKWVDAVTLSFETM